MLIKYLKNCHPGKFGKFLVVGSLSFFIDFFILNLLSLTSGINKGFFVAIFSVISFLTANLNSYYLNKKWTFRDSNKNSNYRTFLTVSVFGALINASVVYSFTVFINQNYFSDLIWLNISKMTATGIVMFFNYFGYKKFVFK